MLTKSRIKAPLVKLLEAGHEVSIKPFVIGSSLIFCAEVSFYRRPAVDDESWIRYEADSELLTKLDFDFDVATACLSLEEDETIFVELAKTGFPFERCHELAP